MGPPVRGRRFTPSHPAGRHLTGTASLPGLPGRVRGGPEEDTAGTGRTKDRSSIVYSSRITLSGIPEEAHEYLLGSRSGVDWVMERYRVRTDKASGIVNDPNDWSREVGDSRYVLDLLRRVVTVSVETVRIVRALPALDVSLLT